MVLGPPYLARRPYRRAFAGGKRRSEGAPKLSDLGLPPRPDDVALLWPILKICTAKGLDLVTVSKTWSIFDVVRFGEALDVLADAEDAVNERADAAVRAAREAAKRRGV